MFSESAVRFMWVLYCQHMLLLKTNRAEDHLQVTLLSIRFPILISTSLLASCCLLQCSGSYVNKTRSVKLMLLALACRLSSRWILFRLLVSTKLPLKVPNTTTQSPLICGGGDSVGTSTAHRKLCAHVASEDRNNDNSDSLTVFHRLKAFFFFKNSGNYDLQLFSKV